MPPLTPAQRKAASRARQRDPNAPPVRRGRPPNPSPPVNRSPRSPGPELPPELARAEQVAHRLARPAPPAVKTRDDVLAGLSREALDLESPAASRVAALRALADLLPPEAPPDEEGDMALFTPGELELILELLSIIKPGRQRDPDRMRELLTRELADLSEEKGS